MKALTLRGVDRELADELQREAKREHDSVNAVILRLLRDRLGLSKPKFRATHHDLDDLAGTWSEEDVREFEDATKSFSQIDPEMWQ